MPAVHLDALGGEHLGDLDVGHRTIQRISLAGLLHNRSDHPPGGMRTPGLLQILGPSPPQILRRCSSTFMFPGVAGRAYSLGSRKLRAYPGATLTTSAPLAQVLHVLTQHDFHDMLSPPPQSLVNGMRAIIRARLIACISTRWCLAQFPEILRGRILDRSGM